jgi:hypothetical protein
LSCGNRLINFFIFIKNTVGKWLSLMLAGNKVERLAHRRKGAMMPSEFAANARAPLCPVKRQVMKREGQI